MEKNSPLNVSRPFYKVVLKHVLQKQIQALIDQLFEETGDETCVLSASLEDKTVVQYGSERAKSFFSNNQYLSSLYLEFLQKAAAKEDSNKRRINNKRIPRFCNDVSDLVPEAKMLKFHPEAETADVCNINDTTLLNNISNQNKEKCQSYKHCVDKIVDDHQPDQLHLPEHTFNELNPVSQNGSSCLKPQDLVEYEKNDIVLQFAIKEETGSLKQQDLITNKNLAQETLEMKVYTEEEQKAVIEDFPALKNEVEANTANICPVDKDQNIEKVLEQDDCSCITYTHSMNTGNVVEFASPDKSLKSPCSEDISVTFYGSDSDSNSSEEDLYNNIIIKTEPFDVDVNMSNENLQSDEHSDSDQHDDLCIDYSGKTKVGNRFARFTARNQLDVDASGDEDCKEDLCDEQSFGKETALDSKSVEDVLQKSKCFKPLKNDSINQLMDKSLDKKTERQTKWAVSMLKDWMLETHYGHSNFEWLPIAELDVLLQQFYASAQTKTGGSYSKSALVGLRAGLNRHLTLPPICRLVNLMKDSQFQASNQVLKGLVKTLKQDSSTHKEPIDESDIKKIYESGVFNADKPETLQNKVLFDLISQFGRRGKEGLRALKKDSFIVLRDAKNRKYVTLACNEVDKFHQSEDSRMYENSDKNCPVSSFEKYIQKLNPECSDFFQKPLQKVTDDNLVWYAARPIGVNTLSNFMSRISKEAGLKRIYTNHCISAYISTKLYESGFSYRAIMSVTGHRHENSRISYLKLSEDERVAISNALSSSSSANSNQDHNM